jgi:hypothetical protein
MSKYKVAILWRGPGLIVEVRPILRGLLRRAVLPTALFVTFCAAAGICAAWGYDTLPITDAKNAPPALLVDCRPIADPIKAPADGRIYIVDLWPSRADGGFIEISVPPGTGYKFSEVSQINYRCSIINDGPEPISASFLLSITFRETQKTDTGTLKAGRTTSEVKWPIQFARIESGSNNSFQFYIHNYSTNFVDAQFSESVREHQAGLQSFRSMRRIDARRKNDSALRLRFSQSFASRRQRLSHAMVRSTTQRRGRMTKPLA